MADGADRRPLVLAVEDDPLQREVFREMLEEEDLACELAADGAEALEKARVLRPDLILLDLGLPGMPGDEVHAALRQDVRTRYIPVILVTAAASLDDRVQHLLAGADDYVTKPFALSELVARIRVALRRARTLRGLNPLTGLPGNAAIADEIASRLGARAPFACLHVDLDHFKEFNDHYGFTRGDAVIAAIGQVLLDAVERTPGGPHFLGHVGGDDFVVLADEDVAEGLAARVSECVDHLAPSLHDEDDARRGWFEAVDRRGHARRIPLVSVSIGIALSSRRQRWSPAELAQVAAEMRAVAKRRVSGSGWAVDRRAQTPAR
ncbi:MAG: GGDEF domain-containing response regulator [Candidatus Limnocylindria bacterium]